MARLKIAVLAVYWWRHHLSAFRMKPKPIFNVLALPLKGPRDDKGRRMRRLAFQREGWNEKVCVQSAKTELMALEKGEFNSIQGLPGIKRACKSRFSPSGSFCHIVYLPEVLFAGPTGQMVRKQYLNPGPRKLNPKESCSECQSQHIHPSLPVSPALSCREIGEYSKLSRKINKALTE